MQAEVRRAKVVLLIDRMETHLAAAAAAVVVVVDQTETRLPAAVPFVPAAVVHRITSSAAAPSVAPFLLPCPLLSLLLYPLP